MHACAVHFCCALAVSLASEYLHVNSGAEVATGHVIFSVVGESEKWIMSRSGRLQAWQVPK